MRKLQILCHIQRNIDLYEMLSNRSKRSPVYQDYQYAITMLTSIQKEIEENLVDKDPE